MDKQKTNLVDCSRCEHWTDDYRRQEVCEQCNNTRETVDPATILCNMCGECMRPLGTHNEQYPHGLEGSKITGGYDSYHLFDMTTYVFSFCEKCLRDMFSKCKIPPTVLERSFAKGDSGYENCTYADDLAQYDYRVWKDNKGHHKAYMAKLCNSAKDCPNRAVYTILHNGDFSEDSACEDHKTTRLYSNSRLTKFISPVLRAFL